MHREQLCSYIGSPGRRSASSRETKLHAQKRGDCIKLLRVSRCQACSPHPPNCSAKCRQLSLYGYPIDPPSIKYLFFDGSSFNQCLHSAGALSFPHRCNSVLQISLSERTMQAHNLSQILLPTFFFRGTASRNGFSTTQVNASRTSTKRTPSLLLLHFTASQRTRYRATQCSSSIEPLLALLQAFISFQSVCLPSCNGRSVYYFSVLGECISDVLSIKVVFVWPTCPLGCSGSRHVILLSTLLMEHPWFI
ncbi:hypothetical protein C8R45DRAFT_446801 [Mycena sanguinolenta]|nr:hypothetical protein C8R45DRAFT_446801 [Mycena sanguinolenta]